MAEGPGGTGGGSKIPEVRQYTSVTVHGGNEFDTKQKRRGFETRPEDAEYKQEGILAPLESGGQICSLTRPAVEYKEFHRTITRDVLDDKEQRQQLIKELFYTRILVYVCAAINARVNMILYLGVRDDGTITGVEIERGLVMYNCPICC